MLAGETAVVGAILLTGWYRFESLVAGETTAGRLMIEEVIVKLVYEVF